jgi:hypothetical protein
MIDIYYATGGSTNVKNSIKSSLAIAMSAAALATFGVLDPRVASASYHECDAQQYYDCGTYCQQSQNYGYSCCGVHDSGGGSFCLCFGNPVDCSQFFS